MIKFQQSQALTSHFESFWSIVMCHHPLPAMTLTFMSVIRWLFLWLKQKLLVVIGEFGDRGGGGGVMAILAMHRTLKPLLVMHLKWTSWFFDDESLVLTRAKGLLQTFHLFLFFSFDIAKSISAKIRIDC